MKNIKLIFSFVVLLAVTISCSVPDGIDQDTNIYTNSPSGLAKIFDITNDNSGNVTITPTGVGVSSYVVKFGQGSGSASYAVVAPGYSTIHSYPEGSYTVTIDAYDIAGKITTTTYPLTLTYRAPVGLKVSTS